MGSAEAHAPGLPRVEMLSRGLKAASRHLAPREASPSPSNTVPKIEKAPPNPRDD